MNEFQKLNYAGFWVRLVAFIIDALVINLLVFPLAFSLCLIFPNSILVEVPFGLFTTNTTIAKGHHGEPSIEKEQVLGLWTNFYEVTDSKDQTGKDQVVRVLIDPVTQLHVTKTTSSDLEFVLIYLYWILTEASVWQASLGKKIMGLRVVTLNGGRPNIYQCTARNLLKVLSIITMLIGFLMAGWTKKKQALHDIISNQLVIKEMPL